MREARTASPADVHIDPRGAEGLILVIDVDAIDASPSVVFTLQGHDPTTNKSWTILASAAIVAVGTTILRVHPNATAVPNLVAHDMLPGDVILHVVHADADEISYAVGLHLVGGGGN